MKHRLALLPSLLFAAIANAAGDTPPDPALTARIVDNLKFEFPQLVDATLAIESLAPIGATGLRAGVVRFDKSSTQNFLVADDGTLYLLANAPMKLRSSEELAVAARERNAREAQENAVRHAELDAITARAPARGKADAPVTLVEFSDYQCPYCARASRVVDALVASHGGKLRYVLVQFPLESIHPWAGTAALAAECAAQQKPAAFWTLTDAYFKHQSTYTKDNVIAQSRTALEGSGIDLARWNDCTTKTGSAPHQAALATIAASRKVAQTIGVSGTPAFFVNGKRLGGVPTLEGLQAQVDAAAGATASGPSP